MALNATFPFSPAPDKFRRDGLILFLAVLLLAVPQAALLPLLDRDEPRFAEASREMLQSGDIIVPTFNHAPRYAKPPLIYWCQALSFTLFGENAFAARLPSLFATAGTAVLLFAWGIQLGDKCIGLIAALSYAFCLQTMQQGRVATADGLLIFFMTLTGYAGWNLLLMAKPAANLNDFRFWKWRLILGLTAGFLAKGPEAWLPLLPLFIIAPMVWRFFLQFFLLSLVFVAAWAVPAYILTNGDYWRVGLSEGIGQRMVTGMQGHGASSIPWYFLSIPLYLLIFWISALPWSPLLVIYRKKLFAAWKPDNFSEKYLLLNAGLIFLVFSLMVTKLPHYTLPAFPFIALFFARRWVTSGLNPALPIKSSAGFGMAFALFALVFIPMARIMHASPSPVGELVRGREHLFTTDTRFAVVDFQEPNVIWEMRRLVEAPGETIDKSEVLSYLDEPGPRAVILTSDLWEEIDLTRDPSDSQLIVLKSRGFNAAKGNFINLTLVVKK